MLILNAFSANMLPTFPATAKFAEISLVEARALLLAEGVDSAVGHSDTAAVFSTVLGVQVAFVRKNVSLKATDRAVLGQYIGPRLAEGATALPEGATIKWLLLEIN